MTDHASAIASMEMRKNMRIDPNKVKINNNGFVYRDMFVRLPAECIADDLKRPELWQRVQTGTQALRKFDRVMIVAYDETWVAEAFVENATLDGVWLAKPRITQFSERADRLFGDGTYQVVWGGAGYHVERIRDGAKVTETYANAPLAERALAGLYPRRA